MAGQATEQAILHYLDVIDAYSSFIDEQVDPSSDSELSDSEASSTLDASSMSLMQETSVDDLMDTSSYENFEQSHIEQPTISILDESNPSSEPELVRSNSAPPMRFRSSSANSFDEVEPIRMSVEELESSQAQIDSNPSSTKDPSLQVIEAFGALQRIAQTGNDANLPPALTMAIQEISKQLEPSVARLKEKQLNRIARKHAVSHALEKQAQDKEFGKDRKRSHSFSNGEVSRQGRSPKRTEPAIRTAMQIAESRQVKKASTKRRSQKKLTKSPRSKSHSASRSPSHEPPSPSKRSSSSSEPTAPQPSSSSKVSKRKPKRSNSLPASRLAKRDSRPRLDYEQRLSIAQQNKEANLQETVRVARERRVERQKEARRRKKQLDREDEKKRRKLAKKIDRKYKRMNLLDVKPVDQKTAKLNKMVLHCKRMIRDHYHDAAMDDRSDEFMQDMIDEIKVKFNTTT